MRTTQRPGFQAPACLLVALCAVVLMLSAPAAAHSSRQLTQACPLNPNTVLSFAAAAPACQPPYGNVTYCDACTCAVFQAFGPALTPAVLTFPAGTNDTAVVTQLRGLLAVCVPAFLPQIPLTLIPSLVPLQQCNYPLPTCVTSLLSTVSTMPMSMPPPPSTPATTNPTPSGAQPAASRGSAAALKTSSLVSVTMAMLAAVLMFSML